MVDRCLTLLDGGADEELLPYVGGPAAADYVRPRPDTYWPRVWAMRAMLYAWKPSAAPAVAAALNDDAWRVREMAAKVCALREIGEAEVALAVRADDDVPRVRAAVARALGAVGEAEHGPILRRLLSDEDGRVRVPAERALRLLSERLERPL